MENKKINKLIVKLKTSAYQLRANYSIPIRLVYYINKVDENTEEKDIRYLMSLCELYLRVKGFYQKYRQFEELYDDEIETLLKDKFN